MKKRQPSLRAERSGARQSTKTRHVDCFVAALLAMTLLFLSSCGEPDRPLPKPKGYFRIDLPEKDYVKIDTLQRYAFEIPGYAMLTNDPFSPEEKNWVNVEMPRFKASIHLTHKDVKGNLGAYLEDVHTMVTKHLQKASGMNDSLILNPERKVYGMVIEMDGKGVATPIQFYLTDSTANFVRGALYFNFVPNNDSMQPVIDYIKQDIDRMIHTFEWK